MNKKSNWENWKVSFDNLNLRDHGDNIEIRAYKDFNLNELFPNYQLFWRYHIVPATNRPANIKLREHTNAVISHLSQLNNNLLLDVLHSSIYLEKVKNNDFGEIRYSNSFDVMTSSGNAIQKFKEIKDHIEKELLNDKLGISKKVWSTNDWNKKWKPKREKIIKYRNFLVHEGQPEIILPKNSETPYVLSKESFYDISNTVNNITWELQQKIYLETPEKWEKLSVVSEIIYKDSIEWLNDAYGEIIKILEPYLDDEDYHNLWGWDTEKNGIHLNDHGSRGAQDC